MVNLLTSDGKTISVEREILNHSRFLGNMLEYLGEQDESIPLHNVNHQILQYALEWCRHHPLPNQDCKSGSELDSFTRSSKANLSDWDEDYFNRFDKDTMFEILKAADYLDIQYLLDLGCKFIAIKLKPIETPQEICEYFGIDTDYTPDADLLDLLD